MVESSSSWSCWGEIRMLGAVDVGSGDGGEQESLV